VGDAEPRLHGDGAGRKRVVGRRGRHHDQVDRGRLDMRGRERRPRRLDGELGRRLTRRSDAPLADAGALGDPFVGGLDPLGEIRVGEHVLGQVTANAQDDRTRDAHEAAPATRAAAADWPPSMRLIFASRSYFAMSYPMSIAAAKPSESVPPWLLITTPLSPRNTPPLERRGSIFSLRARKAPRANR